MVKISFQSIISKFSILIPNFFENNFKMTRIISLNSNNWSINWYKWNYWNKWCNISISEGRKDFYSQKHFKFGFHK
ncbi:hypothetical protein BpHYR1_011128 [Brachionus plicatilis]|uniref:Uncharacterized protein n=1 Tax=Brachionus plicatilis TaxID=10195 RepID=A0A3M7SJV1_BRAPC|nr:hypothetical protein BpHYR1_011128 [Brachionus plicatilis]